MGESMDSIFEKLLVEHCAPALCGLKAANLFRVTGMDGVTVCRIIECGNRKLNPCGISMQIVKQCGTDSFLVYVWRRKWLSHLLRGVKTREFLQTQGYRVDCDVNEMIRQLTIRLVRSENFPHEIGVFLGYPLTDVLGFIRNSGKNYTCAGYWKSYSGNAERAKKGFEAYMNCFRTCMDAYKHGVGVMQMVAAA